MAGAWINPDDYDQVPRPVVGISNDYPPSFELDWHSHGRGQLIYASTGVIVLSTPNGAWIAPPERAIWTPAGMPHSVRMVGAVSTRSLLLDEAAATVLGDAAVVIAVSPLVRHLLIAAAAIPAEYEISGRDGLVMKLLVAELARAPRVALSVPFPASPKLAARCHAFLEAPDIHATIDSWSADLGMDRRAFTRAFRRENGGNRPACWRPCRAWPMVKASPPARLISAMTAPLPFRPCSAACWVCHPADMRAAQIDVTWYRP